MSILATRTRRASGTDRPDQEDGGLVTPHLVASRPTFSLDALPIGGASREKVGRQLRQSWNQATNVTRAAALIVDCSKRAAHREQFYLRMVRNKLFNRVEDIDQMRPIRTDRGYSNGGTSMQVKMINFGNTELKSLA